MNADERATCWLYNVFNKERFAGIMGREGIDLILDASSQPRIDEITALITRRSEALSSVGARSFDMELSDDARSFNFSRMAAAASRSSSRFVQKESELFRSRLGSIALPHFINDIMFDHHVIESPRSSDAWLCKDRSPGNNVKVRWEQFSDLIADREHSVKDGWIFVEQELVVPKVVKLFRVALERNIAETRKKLANNPDLKVLLENFAPAIDGSSGSEPVTIDEGTPVLDILANSPMCMRLLDSAISRGVDIGYDAYLILSFYLKTFVDREVLVTYFFERNPENTRNYSNVSDYLSSRKELDYRYKQMFGEAGGGTSYLSFGCDRMHDDRNCPFCDAGHIVEVMESNDGQVLDTMRKGPRARVLELIRDLTRAGDFTRACGLEFQTRYFPFYIQARLAHGSEIDKKKYISYPVAYFWSAIKILEKRNAAPRPDEEPSSDGEGTS